MALPVPVAEMPVPQPPKVIVPLLTMVRLLFVLSPRMPAPSSPTAMLPLFRMLTERTLVLRPVS
jgi:hypothetical protein